MGKPEAKANVDLSRLLDPSSIAVVGASTNPKSISGQPLYHMLKGRFEGKLYPVNPNRAEVQGMKAYRDVLSLPESCDVAVVVVSAPNVPKVLEQCGEAGIPFAVVITGGFAEIGEAGSGMQGQLDAAIRKSGVRVVGPNCVGVMNVIKRAYCAFGGALSDPSLKPGPLAIVSQSGGVGQAMMTFANVHGVGSNYVISCGNEADLTFFDFAHHLLDQPEVKVIASYLEASTAGAALRDLGRHALEVGKPILMLKVGNAGAGRRAARSHTGKLTADYTLFEMTFREGGYIAINDLDELADLARLAMGGRYAKGRNVGILTGSGGWGVMMAENCERHGLRVPEPSSASKEKLIALQSTFASINNPIDIMANYLDQHRAMECVIDDPAFDQFLVRSGAGPDVSLWADRFIETAGKTEKPVIVNWASVPGRDPAVKEKIENAGFLCVNYASRAARAAGVFTDFALKRRQFLDARLTAAGRPVMRQALNLANTRGTLSERAAKECLARYGIASTREVLLGLDDLMALDACPIPFPVAVKVMSPDIPHKTEAQAVRLGMQTLDELKRAAQEVSANAHRHVPQARIEGISIQEMASGIEVIVGAVNHRQFGPYVMVGLGGVFTEIVHDVAHRFAPLTPATAREMLSELKGAKLFEGYRGAPAADLEAVIDVLVRVSWLVADHAADIGEIDINPLFVRARGLGAVAADALIVTAK